MQQCVSCFPNTIPLILTSELFSLSKIRRLSEGNFMTFTLLRSVTQVVSTGIWNRLADSISFNENHNVMRLRRTPRNRKKCIHSTIYIYIYIVVKSNLKPLFSIATIRGVEEGAVTFPWLLDLPWICTL